MAVSESERETSASTPAGDVPSRPAAAGRSHVLLLALLSAGTLLAYSNSFHTGFPLDNKFQILEDPRITSVTGDHLNLIFTQDYLYPQVVSGVYRPVATLTYLFNFAVLGSGDHPESYHWVNMALHWLSITLAYLVMLRVLRATGPAFAATAIWALHPTSTECVTNIIGRSNLIAASAVLAALLCHVKGSSAPGWRKAPWLVALMVLTTIGLFSKESAIVILAVMLLYDVTFWSEARWVDRLPGYVALMPPLVLFWQVRTHLYAKLALMTMPFVDNPLLAAGFWTGKLTAIKVIGEYVWLLAYPRALAPDRSYNQIPLVTWRFDNWEDWKAILAVTVCTVAILVAIRCYQRCKPVFFFVMFFFATLFPMANLAVLIGPIMAERFLYLPALGFAGCLVVAIESVARRISARYAWSAWLAPASVAVICLAFGVRTFARNVDWTDDEALWTSGVKVTPGSFKAHRSLAFALNEKYPNGEKLDQSISEIERSLEILSDLPDDLNTASAYSHAGTYYRHKGDTLATKGPNDVLVPTKASLDWYNKALLAMQHGVRIDRAWNEEYHRKEVLRGKNASQIPNSGWAELYVGLGVVYMRLGQPSKALTSFQYALTLQPASPILYVDIAAAYSSLEDNRQAAIALVAGLILNPHDVTIEAGLDAVYRQLAPTGCAIVRTGGMPRFNAACPLVHEHVCLAYESLVRLFVDIKQEDVADRLKTAAVGTLGCSAAPFNKILPERPIF
jgi:tetratricopeptide (TPR) repeat protein